MTVREIAEKHGFRVLSMPFPDREVKGGYAGDLLSWVMGRAAEGNLWITIMTNMNVVAVASLAEVSAVLIAEGAIPEKEVTELAEEKGVNILCTDKNIYETSVAVSEDI